MLELTLLTKGFSSFHKNTFFPTFKSSLSQQNYCFYTVFYSYIFICHLLRHEVSFDICFYKTKNSMACVCVKMCLFMMCARVLTTCYHIFYLATSMHAQPKKSRGESFCVFYDPGLITGPSGLAKQESIFLKEHNYFISQSERTLRVVFQQLDPLKYTTRQLRLKLKLQPNITARIWERKQSAKAISF